MNKVTPGPGAMLRQAAIVWLCLKSISDIPTVVSWWMDFQRQRNAPDNTFLYANVIPLTLRCLFPLLIAVALICSRKAFVGRYLDDERHAQAQNAMWGRAIFGGLGACLIVQGFSGFFAIWHWLSGPKNQSTWEGWLYVACVAASLMSGLVMVVRHPPFVPNREPLRYDEVR